MGMYMILDYLYNKLPPTGPKFLVIFRQVDILAESEDQVEYNYQLFHYSQEWKLLDSKLM